MKHDLSSLLDDELDTNSRDAALRALCGDGHLRVTLSRYRLIGDALREDVALDTDLTERVMTRLQREPTLFLPHGGRATNESARRRLMVPPWRHLTALAATLAGLGVVGWLALSAPQLTGQPTDMQLARVSAVVADPVAVKELAPDQRERLRGYLVAHQAYSPGSRFDGGAGYVRTVAATR
jgi:sigma-E factor negative regulatory protein RseA